MRLCAYCRFFFHSSPYTYHGNKEETVFKNQNVLSVVNMSFLLMTFMLNLTVTCLGEVWREILRRDFGNSGFADYVLQGEL